MNYPIFIGEQMSFGEQMYGWTNIGKQMYGWKCIPVKGRKKLYVLIIFYNLPDPMSFILNLPKSLNLLNGTLISKWQLDRQGVFDL